MKSGFCRLVLKNKELIMAIFASAIVAFLFLVNSPLHPWRYGSTLTDSSVFKTVALMMEKGYMPYRDSFDHKGPLLYVINYYGMKIAYYRGVWFFEFVFLMITVFLFYKIARLVVSATASALVALTAFSMLFDYFGGGNYTEEYAMTFIAIGIYIFLDYLLNNRSSRFRIFLSGFLMGSVCLLRANMIAVWMVFCTAIFCLKIAKREWKQLRQFVLWFVVGFLMIVVPFVIWLAVNDALSACIADYLFLTCSTRLQRVGLPFLANAVQF